MKDEDDSGDEAEARHLLEKRREQAKYDAVRGRDSGGRLSYERGVRRRGPLPERLGRVRLGRRFGVTPDSVLRGDISWHISYS